MNLPRPNPCSVLAKPLQWMPQWLHSTGLAAVLNRVFADSLVDGGMDFLQGKTLQILVSDVGIQYRLRFAHRQFAPAGSAAKADVRFSGSLQTFLLLATRREDADSLFFRRLLRIEGDTATGLYLKNFIDALEELPLPEAAREAIERFTDLHTRYCTDA